MAHSLRLTAVTLTTGSKIDAINLSDTHTTLALESDLSTVLSTLAYVHIDELAGLTVDTAQNR